MTISNRALHIHEFLRGEGEGIAVDQMHADLMVLARTCGGPVIFKSLLIEALAELEKAEMAVCENGLWRWQPEKAEKATVGQRELF